MKTYTLDGSRIHTIDDFYREIGEVVNGPGGYFGQNLDALNDCFYGHFGTPPIGEYEFVWLNSAESRDHLGFAEQVRYDTALIELTPEHDKDRLRRRVDAAERRAARTPFERFLQVFDGAGVPLELR